MVNSNENIRWFLGPNMTTIDTQFKQGFTPSESQKEDVLLVKIILFFLIRERSDEQGISQFLAGGATARTTGNPNE